MPSNQKLNRAMRVKNDEFYTLKNDIVSEIQAYLKFNPNLFVGKTVLCPCDDPKSSNFTDYFVEEFNNLGLKELISTCYCENNNGRILRKTKSQTTVSLLKGDGDFRSDELIALRNQADFVITNPPFSLFREFMAWLIDGEKQFSVICNKNCVTFKDILPKIKANEIWSGHRPWAGGMWFETADDGNVDKVVNGVMLKNVSAIWLTNIEHARRYSDIVLKTKEENLAKHPSLKGKNAYCKYDNYDAIEIPLTKAIPSDYNGVMGVPISFLDKFNPLQFQFIGATESEGKGFSNGIWHSSSGVMQASVNGKKVYKRIFVKLIPT